MTLLIDISVIEDAEELREMLYDWIPVIEAAQAYCDAMDGVPGAGEPENKWGPLWDAVRALDALEVVDD